MKSREILRGLADEIEATHGAEMDGAIYTYDAERKKWYARTFIPYLQEFEASYFAEMRAALAQTGRGVPNCGAACHFVSRKKIINGTRYRAWVWADAMISMQSVTFVDTGELLA